MSWLTQCPMNLGEMAVLAFIGGGAILGGCAVLFCAWVGAWGWYDKHLERRMTFGKPNAAANRECFNHKGAMR